MLTLKEIENIFIERLSDYRNVQVDVREEEHPELDADMIRVIASWQVDNLPHKTDVIIENEIRDRSTIDGLIDGIIKRHGITPVGTMDVKANGKGV